MITIKADRLQDGLYNIKSGQIFKYKAKGGTVRTYEMGEIVRCEDCRHANECHKSVQYTRHELNTVTIGYSPIEWCSRGERREE